MRPMIVLVLCVIATALRGRSTFPPGRTPALFLFLLAFTVALPVGP